jgi:hypothetical protein
VTADYRLAADAGAGRAIGAIVTVGAGATGTRGAAGARDTDACPAVTAAASSGKATEEVVDRLGNWIVGNRVFAVPPTPPLPPVPAPVKLMPLPPLSAGPPMSPLVIASSRNCSREKSAGKSRGRHRVKRTQKLVTVAGAAGVAAAASAVALGLAPMLVAGPQLTATTWYLRGTNIGDNPPDSEYVNFLDRMLTGSGVAAGGTKVKVDYPAELLAGVIGGPE